MTTIDELIELAKSAPQSKVEPRTLNAYRHRLTGHVRFTTPGDEQAYKKHCEAYLDERNPIGAIETDLTQSVADYRWRIKRAAQIENAIVAITLGRPNQIKCAVEAANVAYAQAQAWLDSGKDLNLLTLYERRLQRAFQDDFKLLNQLQERRFQREDEQREAAAQSKLRYGRRPTAEPERPEPKLEPKLDFSNRPLPRKVPVPSPPLDEILAA
jgi:hypothetical protein